MAARPRIQRALRQCVHKIQYLSSAAWCKSRLSASPAATILMYHSVPDVNRAPWIDPANAMAPERFRSQMRFLAKHRHVVSLTQLVEMIQRHEPIARGTVVLTFDDGYLDNLDVVTPILKNHGLPATLYLPTTYIDDERPQWIDELYTCIRYRTRDTLTLVGFSATHWQLDEPGQLETLRRELISHLIEATYSGREALLDHLSQQLQPKTTMPQLTMGWEQVRQLRRAHPGWEIGGHTATHIDLSCHTDEHARSEIECCMNTIKQHIGDVPRHFSFPYGRSTDVTRKYVKDAGWLSSVHSQASPRIQSDADPHAMGRIESPLSSILLRYYTFGAS